MAQIGTYSKWYSSADFFIMVGVVEEKNGIVSVAAGQAEMVRKWQMSAFDGQVTE